MRSALAAALAGLLSLGGAPAESAEPSEALAVIQKFSAAANGTDPEAYAAFCAADVVFVDHVPPYVFGGPRACQAEWVAELAWMARDKIVVSDYSKITGPSFVDATADRVYAVYPVTATLTRNGKPEIEKGAWTFVVRREPGGWRIASVTWSTVEFVPATDARAPGPGR